MTFKYENQKHKQGYTHIIGCDEVGRGSLAGPVVAVAIIMKPETWGERYKIRDSKMLSQEQREKLQPLIKQHCLAWGIGFVDEKIIDKTNIHRATLAAMKLAVENLLCHCEAVAPTEAIFAQDEIASSSAKALTPRNDKHFLVIDGKFTIPELKIEQEAVVDGDNKILSIAAASIVAKVYRDDLMCKLHKKYPLYDFARHKGYGTLFHRKMILKNGLSPIHRKSFCKNLSGVHFPLLSIRGG
jgi:ribonuclease HII